MLYNEMDNSEHANKLLSEHIEQQILINNVYNIILERKDSSEALKAIIKLVGEYMGMRRVCVYEDFPEEEKIRLSYKWKSSRSPDSALPEYSYSDLGKIIERLEYTDMYISAQSPEQSDENKLKLEYCTAGNLNGDGKRFGIITFAPLSPGYVPTAQESKVLRSISQITATLLIQMKADEKLKEADDKLRRLAFYDPILEIPNRAMLDRDLDSELDSGGRGAAAVIKITNLQIFNELFGHEYTDNMLHDAAMFVSDMKVTGLTVYRFSGNTLMFLLRENSEEGVKELIEKIMKRFGQPWLHENGEHYLDAGIGATFYPDGHSTRGEIYRAAALAMYKATEYGANSYAFYSDDFKTEADVNYSHIQRLHECVNNDMKGFSIEYQPMAAADGSLTDCYEAYIRWDYLPTQKLVQLAESTGLDVAVDSWVIKNACLFCKKMQEHKPDFSVSVNITSRELHSGSIISTVEQTLRETGLGSGSLWIEIPAQAFSNRRDSVIHMLKRLHGIGVKLVLDSFGSDYEGLRLLKHSMFDMVKIDVSLFTNIFSEFDETWVGTVAKLAASLKDGICVKRVEDKEQLLQAQKFGFKYAQGFMLAQPVTGEEVLRSLQKAVRHK
jgi:diguanylate cyclase (GGDEF)-like protein